MPFVRRTRATLRSAEFGFFGVCVYTRVQTPRRWGAPASAGVLVLLRGTARPLRTSWLTVGMDLRMSENASSHTATVGGAVGPANRSTDGSGSGDTPQTAETAWSSEKSGGEAPIPAGHAGGGFPTCN